MTNPIPSCILLSLVSCAQGGMEAQLYGSSILAADLFQLNVTPIVNASLLFAGAVASSPQLKRKVERLHQDRGREVGHDTAQL